MSDFPAEMHQTKLKSIKRDVKSSWDNFRHNYDLFNKFKMFLYKSNWTENQRAGLNSVGKPDMEFNVLQSFVDRLLGEFSKQEPSIEISSDEIDQLEVMIIKTLEQHADHVVNGDEATEMKFSIWKDLLVGGFSVGKVYTDYKNAMSMQQEIIMERAFDPTMCAFDPIARKPHKGDGRYCVEIFPMGEEEFKREYPKVPLKDFGFINHVGDFSWSYQQGVKKVIVVADYYVKAPQRFKICQLRDGRIMKMSEYDEMLASWSDISMPPAIVGKPRWTTVDRIDRYRVVENKVLEHEETDYNMLPLVFFSGNSEILRKQNDGPVTQFCKPYIYHAYDAQKFKNFCGSSWANAVENEVQHKWLVAKEALPKEDAYRNAIIDNQHANAIVYNSVHENNPAMPILNPIQPVPKVPAPPEVMQGFQVVDSLMQMILGSYDSSLGINNNQLSGIAVTEAATQSNAAAMPYMVGFLQGLERMMQIYVDLFPKYNVTPRTLPIRTKEGKRAYVKINQQDDPKSKMEYQYGVLNVKIKAGASFQVQKSRTIMMVKDMMGMSPLFQQFIGEKGLNFVLDNMEGRGIEQLKEQVQEFVQGIEQQKQMAMQAQQAEAQQNQKNPAIMRAQIDAQKLQLEQEKMQMQHKIDLLKLELEHNKIDAELHMSYRKDAMELHKAELDHGSKMIDHSIKAKDVDNKHVIASKGLEKKKSEARKKPKKEK